MGKKTVAIIGGGAAGISAFYQLVELCINQTATNVKIIVIEKTGVMGSGLAYGADIDSTNLLNLDSSIMSPVPGYPTHFIEWLQDEKQAEKWRPFFPELDIENCRYLPRPLFGIYLSHLAESTKQYAHSKNIEVEFLHDEVVDLERFTNIQAELTLLNAAQKLRVDTVVLCVGHLPPSQKEYQSFKSLKHYYQTPWQKMPSNMVDIPIHEDVIILGTRLTAIDAILMRSAAIERAKEAGYDGVIGKIFAVSRSGLLPCVIGKTEPYQRSILTLEKIEDITAGGTKFLTLKVLKKLFKQEMKAAYKQLRNKDFALHIKTMLKEDLSTSPIDWLQREINASKNYSRPWQTVLASLYSIVPKLWKVLHEKDKQEFLEKYYSPWMTYLAAFPLENAEKILGLLQEGRLQVLGGLKSISFNDESQQFTTILSAASPENSVDKQLNAKYVINATGQGHDITQADSPLLKKLLERQLIVPHPLGGIKVHFRSLQVIDFDKSIPIFVVGDGGTWGTCMATADLGQVAKQAQRVVNSITKSLFFHMVPNQNISPSTSPSDAVTSIIQLQTSAHQPSSF